MRFSKRIRGECGLRIVSGAVIRDLKPGATIEPAQADIERPRSVLYDVANEFAQD